MTERRSGGYALMSSQVLLRDWHFLSQSFAAVHEALCGAFHR